MCVFILSLDNMLFVLPLSPTSTSQFIILISQVFILLVTFSLTHHILWIDIHHLPSVAKYESSFQIIFIVNYVPPGCQSSKVYWTSCYSFAPTGLIKWEGIHWVKISICNQLWALWGGLLWSSSFLICIVLIDASVEMYLQFLVICILLNS